MKHVEGLALLLALAACSGSSGGGGSSSPDAGTIAHSMAGDLGNQVTAVYVLNEDTDLNNLLGRPGGYTSAAVLNDADLPDKKKPQTEDGATVEVFSSTGDAQARLDHIKAVYKAANGMIGTEYDVLDGAALLRVIGDVKPSVEQQYVDAFKKALG